MINSLYFSLKNQCYDNELFEFYFIFLLIANPMCIHDKDFIGAQIFRRVKHFELIRA